VIATPRLDLLPCDEATLRAANAQRLFPGMNAIVAEVMGKSS